MYDPGPPSAPQPPHIPPAQPVQPRLSGAVPPPPTMPHPRPEPPARPVAGFGPPSAPGQASGPPKRPRKALRVVLIGLAALVGAAVVTAVLAGGNSAGRSAPTPQPDSGQAAAPASLQPFDLRAGDCYNDSTKPPADGEVQQVGPVDVVPCTSPHSYQIVAKIAYKPTDEFTDVTARKGSDCVKEFAKLSRSVRNDARYRMGYLMPLNAASWAANRSVACFLFSEAPTVTSALT